MRDDARERGCPDPVYKATNFFTASFYPNPAVKDQVTPQVGKLIGALQGEMSRGEIIEALGLKDRMHFVNEYLQPALNAGLVKMTIPEKPRSRMQKYRLTEEGIQLHDILGGTKE
jgi:ATP-dependent DNA helicase RecG